MDYKKIIDKNITKAFNLLKSLAVVAELTKKTDVKYNFATSSVSQKETPLPVLAIVTGNTKRSSGSTASKQEILLKTQEVVDLSIYDTIKINNVIWKLGEPISNDGFITLIQVFKEA